VRTIIQQLAATLAVAAYAGAAWLSGTDRLAKDDPSVRASLAWPYAANALVNAAHDASRDHDWGRADALMSRALLTDPVHESVVGGLGQIRLDAGDHAGAETAFRVSVLRGWRDPATHLFWMAKSLDYGDMTAASLHADALLRQALDYKQRDAIINPLLEYNEGRDAVARRLDGRPPWAALFTYGIDNESDEALAARADVIGRTRAPGIWSCLDTSGLIDRLISAGYATEARRAHDVTCTESGRLINDGHFVRYLADGRASTMDWLTPAAGDIAIGPTRDGAGRTGIQITQSRGVTLLVLAQRLVTPPGLYRLRWSMPDTDPATAAHLLAGIDCVPDLARSRAGTPVEDKSYTYTADFRIGPDCPIPTLGFWLQPTPKAVSVDDVTLIRVDN
jgi:hypothetical protein